MKNISIKNIIKLIKKFFIERWKIEMFTYLAIFLALFSTYYFCRTIGRAFEISIIIEIGILGTMIVLAANIFSPLVSKKSSVLYLTLPANSSEKVIANLLISNIIRPLSFVLSWFVGSALAFLLPIVSIFNRPYNVYFQNFWDKITRFQSFELGIAITIFFLALAIFSFASVYFRKSALIKMLLTFLVVFTIFCLFNVLAVFGITEYFNHYGIIDKIELIVNPIVYKIILFSFLWLVTIFFWILSYFRLKETEV